MKLSISSKNDDTSVTFVKPKASLSQVWSSFSLIYHNNYKQNFVCCDNCKEILAHTSSNGTSSMTKHQSTCTKTTCSNIYQKNIKEYFSRTTSEAIPKKIKQKITTAAAEFVVLDNRPFHLLSGGGFSNFAKTVFDVGKSMYNMPNINIENLLPHPTTVSKTIDKLC